MIFKSHGLFTPDWPRYAILAHLAFWLSSAALVAAIAAGAAGLVPGRVGIFLFVIWLFSALLFGGAALMSGKVYVGKQVFARVPTTGLPARMVGGFVVAAAGALLLFGYMLTTVHSG